MVRQVSASADPSTLFRGVAARYRPCGRAAYHYVASKLRWDPVHRAVLDLPVEFGSVVDLGCGHGQLGITLLVAGRAATVLGIDCHEAHLRQARQAGAGLAFRGVVLDLAQASELPAADTVLLVDVLYQLDVVAQLALLRRAAAAAGRTIVVRALDPGRGWRSRFTVGLENLLRRVSPNSGATVKALPVAALLATLRDAGFQVSVTPCWRGTPFANVLLFGSRVATTAPAGASP